MWGVVANTDTRSLLTSASVRVRRARRASLPRGAQWAVPTTDAWAGQRREVGLVAGPLTVHDAETVQDWWEHAADGQRARMRMIHPSRGTAQDLLLSSLVDMVIG